MFNAFANADLGADLVLESSQREGHGWETLVSFSEELARLLDLEVVHVLELALVDGGADLAKLWLAFAAGNKHVQVDNLTALEVPALDGLEWLLLGNDGLVAVDAVLLDSVGEHTLDHVALELRGHLVHSFGHLLVVSSFSDHTLSSSKSSVGSVDHVGLLGISLVVTNDHRVGGVSSKAIDVSTTLNLSDIAILHLAGLVLEGREVSHDIVEGDAGGHGNTTLDLLGLLTVVNLGQFLSDEGINFLANLVDIGIWLDKTLSMLHGSISNLGGSLILVKLTWLINEVLLHSLIVKVFCAVNHVFVL